MHGCAERTRRGDSDVSSVICRDNREHVQKFKKSLKSFLEQNSESKIERSKKHGSRYSAVSERRFHVDIRNVKRIAEADVLIRHE